ncbi:MAG: protoporphyrinogen oxidase [Acidobacteria bacterium]|nr:protoporphyrinogen oxidase [Acidobacteriota bacterium]
MLEALIIGGGISGLTVAYLSGFLERQGSCELWEASHRLGGTIGTDRAEGYSVDWGPNGFLDREPLTLRLAGELGLKELLEPANSKSEERFIVKHGRLHPVPFSPAKMLTTGLLRPIEKARVFCEPLIPGRRDDGDESVFDFAARRIGRAAAETFVDPMVSGIHGGLARELSLPSCFPIMREMELRYGCLVRALIARQREKRRSRNAGNAIAKKSGGPAGPGGHLTSFKSGFDLIIRRLEDRLQPIIKKNRPVVRMSRTEQGWEITDQTGSKARAKKVVIACPTYAAAEFLKDFDPELSEAFGSIPYAPIIVLATGHRREDIGHPLDGFGFLIPRTQGMRTLGSIWTSSIFTERAPEGFVQFRSMLGGAGDPAVLELSDEQLCTTLRNELDPLIGIKNDPSFMRIYRWERGIPQYKIGHRERRSRIEQLVSRHPGLYISGNAYYGVGLNDCVKMAYRIAEQVGKP